MRGRLGLVGQAKGCERVVKCSLFVWLYDNKEVNLILIIWALLVVFYGN